MNQSSYTNIPHFSGQSLVPSIPNPAPHHHSLSSDPSFSYHPPGFNPFPDSGHYPSNYAGFTAPPVSYSDPAAVSASWVVKQSGPVTYSPAIQPLRNEAISSISYDAPPNYNLIYRKHTNIAKKTSKGPKAILKKPTVSQSVRCQLCNIECNNVQAYEKHLSGKKHGKGLLKLYAPALESAARQASQPSTGGESTPGVTTKPASLEVKKQKLLEGGAAVQSVRVCTICNVACNGEVAFADHLVGKKHLAQERAHGKVVDSNPASVSTLENNAQHNLTKKRKNAEPALAWCDICKISCTSNDGLNIHLLGKKHQKNLQKLQNLNSNTVTPASSAGLLSIQKKKKIGGLPSTNPSTGVENTAAAQPSVPEPQQAKKKDQSKDIETKKRNVLECGASANAVRTCTICSVVCNSETVFNSHLAGQKHAAMVKQAVAASASSGLQVVYPAA